MLITYNGFRDVHLNDEEGDYVIPKKRDRKGCKTIKKRAKAKAHKQLRKDLVKKSAKLPKGLTIAVDTDHEFAEPRDERDERE